MNDFDRDDSAGESQVNKGKEQEIQEAVADDKDEDDYSDDDFEQQVDAGPDLVDERQQENIALQVIHENTNESRDQDSVAFQDVYDDDAAPYGHAAATD
jgi:hypothetical protein